MTPNLRLGERGENMDRLTPRTNVAEFGAGQAKIGLVYAEFARQLERELIEAKTLMQPGQIDAVIQGIRERDEKIIRLEREIQSLSQDSVLSEQLQDAKDAANGCLKASP